MGSVQPFAGNTEMIIGVMLERCKLVCVAAAVSPRLNTQICLSANIRTYFINLVNTAVFSQVYTI